MYGQSQISDCISDVRIIANDQKGRTAIVRERLLSQEGIVAHFYYITHLRTGRELNSEGRKLGVSAPSGL